MQKQTLQINIANQNKSIKMTNLERSKLHKAHIMHETEMLTVTNKVLMFELLLFGIMSSFSIASVLISKSTD